MEVRTRFAPSPTGFLHIGAIRTALYCYALARSTDGKFILRIEDTDQNRLVPGAIDGIFEILLAYGIEPDESIKHGGDKGPYQQSERLDLYREYADKLVDAGAAYYCFMTDEEVGTQKQIGRADKKPFRSIYRDLDSAEARERAKTESFVIRQKMPANREVEFEDQLQGKMKFNTDDVDEGVLLKSDGFPTYHLAVVVDDHFMEISHVFRGQEWIPSIPKHVLIYEALGFEMPLFYHIPVILDPAGGKLSKRKGAISGKDFLKNGFLPEAVLNLLMLLGWASPIEKKHGETEQEMFDLQEFVATFKTEDLNRSNATFNDEKLVWFNKQYIAGSDTVNLCEKLVAWLQDYAEDKTLLDHIANDDGLVDKLELVKTRSNTLVELLDSIEFFYLRPEGIDWDIKQTKKLLPLLEEILGDIYDLLSGFDQDARNWTHEEWEMGMRAIADKYEIKHGDAFMILRVAVVGQPFSPPLFESLQILGKQEVLARVGVLAE